MRRLDGSDPNVRKRVDMSEMPIANMKCNCETCKISQEFKEMCTGKVNTLKCLTTQKRFLKSIHQTEDRDEDSDSTEEELEEQNRSVRSFLNSIAVSEKDDDDEDDKPAPKTEPKKESTIDEEEDDDEDDD